jgi:hypothetical protein
LILFEAEFSFETANDVLNDRWETRYRWRTLNTCDMNTVDENREKNPITSRKRKKKNVRSLLMSPFRVKNDFRKYLRFLFVCFTST